MASRSGTRTAGTTRHSGTSAGLVARARLRSDRTETDAAGRRACPGFRVTRRCGMRWLVEFYNEGRGIVARYGIEASLPAAAALLGRNALLAEHPPARARRRLSLFERAGRVGGQGGSGWDLHRNGEDTGAGAACIPPPPAALTARPPP